MSGYEDDRRKGPVHLDPGDRATWTQTVVTVIAVVATVAASWSSLESKTEAVPQMQKDMVTVTLGLAEMRAELRANGQNVNLLIDQLRRDAEGRVALNERRFGKLELLSEDLKAIREGIGELRATANRNEQNLSSIWPRIRRLEDIINATQKPLPK